MEAIGMLLAVAVLGLLVWKFGLWRLASWLLLAMIGTFVYGILSARGLTGGQDHDDW
jgi:hypothetical protein